MEFLLRNRCNINEKISENTKSIINEILENEKAIAKKKRISPKPNVFFRLVFSLNFEYAKTTKSKNDTKRMLVNSVGNTNSGSAFWYNRNPVQSPKIGNKNQKTCLSFKSCIKIKNSVIIKRSFINNKII